MRRIRRTLLAAMVAGTVLVPALPAWAPPINCPGNQTPTKTATGWDCVNQGGNTSNAEDPKNPNKGKGDF